MSAVRMQAVVLGACMVFAAVPNVQAQEPYYKGKRITVLINFAAGGPTEHQQRLADGAGCSVHERALSSLHQRRAVKKLVCGCPAQDQRGRLCCVDARGHAGQVAGPQRAVGGVRPDHRQIGHSVTKPIAAHVVTKLVDFPDEIVTQRERWPAAHRLRIQMAPDHHIGVLQTGGEHADAHLAPAGRWHRSVDHLQPVGIAEALELNDPVAQLSHGLPYGPHPGARRKMCRFGRPIVEEDQLQGRSAMAQSRHATAKRRLDVAA